MKTKLNPSIILLVLTNFDDTLVFANRARIKHSFLILIYEILVSHNGSSINDVTEFWTIFDPPPYIITRLINKAIVLFLQSPCTSPPKGHDVIYG